MMSTYTISRLNYFAVWKDQDIICYQSVCNSDSQLSVDLYRVSVILFPGTAWRKTGKG